MKTTDSKWTVGTRFEIVGAPKAVDNGTFVLTTHFPQPTGPDSWLWRRVRADGSVSAKNDAKSLRGTYETFLDQYATAL